MSAAFSCASRYCKTYVITASLDQVMFKNPITVGDLVASKCHANHAGRSSMEIGIRVEGEKICEKTNYHAISCYFTMISVNESGNSQKVPRLMLETEAEEKLFQAGKMRQEIQERNLQLYVDIET